ncbi:MAG: nucleoside 2-deoxyribosyltransferase domain-containing protein [Candidatus Buchananbacteria bacterium]|jgi:8-oxo-dGTP pyrophosphatase MutT (NUDIX family)
MSNEKFTLVRAQQPFPRETRKSIFLLGPIPRLEETMEYSWKMQAYRLLEELGFDGIVYDPEHEVAYNRDDFEYVRAPQINWEVEAMNRADIIIAWVPRQFPSMPALTSNIEMGEFFKTGKLLIGYPEDAQRMEYIKFRSTEWLEAAYKWQITIYHDLRRILQAAIDRIGAGALRRDGETAVPLDIWQDKTFQAWYGGLRIAGHTLEDFKVEYVYYRRHKENGSPQSKVWVVRPKVWIAGENRYKDNELVIGRPATVSVLMYYPKGVSMLDWQVVLVKEYRSAVMNHLGMVYELPGGSIEPLDGVHDERVILFSAMREVEEETGITLDASRLRQMDVRQTMATMVACENHLFIYRLDENEFRDLKAKQAENDPQQIEDNAENTSVEIYSIEELMFIEGAVPIDWVNMGMIAKLLILGKNNLLSELMEKMVGLKS